MWEPAGEGNSIETQTRFNISLRAGGKLSPRGAAAPNGRHLHCPHTMIVVCLHLQGLGFFRISQAQGEAVEGSPGKTLHGSPCAKVAAALRVPWHSWRFLEVSFSPRAGVHHFLADLAATVCTRGGHCPRFGASLGQGKGVSSGGYGSSFVGALRS